LSRLKRRSSAGYNANRKFTQDDLDNSLEKYGLKKDGSYSRSPRHTNSWDDVKARSGPVYKVTIDSDGNEQRKIITEDQLPSSNKREARRRCRRQKEYKIRQLASLPYDEYLNTDHWRRVSRKKLNQVGNRCQRCGKHKNLNVHHLTYRTRGHEKMVDLMVLCGECHEAFHRSHRLSTRGGRFVPRDGYSF
jgi:5-methylcytosine-specific restriction endonuclease McrA